MSKRLLGTLFLVCLTFVSTFSMTLSRTKAATTFTGNPAADFTGPNVIKIDDLEGDVGMPTPDFPADTRSGWDMRALYLEYDAEKDTLYVGIDCINICGDADADGNINPDNDTGDILGKPASEGGLGGKDVKDFGLGESFGLLIDTDNDFDGTTGEFEVVVGVKNSDDISKFGAYNYSGRIGGQLRNLGWGAKLGNSVTLFATPSASTPDIEFSIADFSTLPGFPAGGTIRSYKVHMAMGSIIDDGIGEDFMPDQLQPIAITPTPEPPATATQTPTNTPIPPTDTPTHTPVPPTNTPTDTPVPPTSTPTNTSVPPTNTPTNTPVPPTSTPTNTPVPPTSTPTNTPTDTPVPPTSTPTNTPVPPTDTPTNTPVPPTNTPTNTPVPPTNTPTHTPIPPTDTPTDTPIPPTDTPTNTPTLEPPTAVPTTGAALNGLTQPIFAQAVLPKSNAASKPLRNGQPSYLQIPRLAVQVPVDAMGWHGVVEPDGSILSQWDEVGASAGWFKNSAIPGSAGNVIISGHNNIYGAIFQDLWKLRAGDAIHVWADQSHYYTYQVDSVVLRPETNVDETERQLTASYIQQFDDSRLTLISCWPPENNTHRVFVVAHLQSTAPTTGQRSAIQAPDVQK